MAQYSPLEFLTSFSFFIVVHLLHFRIFSRKTVWSISTVVCLQCTWWSRGYQLLSCVPTQPRTSWPTDQVMWDCVQVIITADHSHCHFICTVHLWKLLMLKVREMQLEVQGLSLPLCPKIREYAKSFPNFFQVISCNAQRAAFLSKWIQGPSTNLSL